ncbi:hypothetical protein [Paenibacillus sp. FSL H3-0457]|uniref:hypothetical protein n=1 Tax=Paenibacillus sp. FSL H3-0457 TaxID=2921430 RepID=UPI0030EBABB0
MTNYNVFNQSNRPLFTQLTNTFSAPGIEASPDSGAAAAGSFFALTTNNTLIPSNQSLLLQILNAVSGPNNTYIQPHRRHNSGSYSCYLFRRNRDCW